MIVFIYHSREYWRAKIIDGLPKAGCDLNNGILSAANKLRNWDYTRDLQPNWSAFLACLRLLREVKRRKLWKLSNESFTTFCTGQPMFFRCPEARIRFVATSTSEVHSGGHAADRAKLSSRHRRRG